MPRIFVSDEPNTFYYVTFVCTRRARVLADPENCRILAEVIDEIRDLHPFKLCSYVFMPDHVHLILNPLQRELSCIMNKIKGKSGRLIINRLMDEGAVKSLERLRLYVSGRRHAVWQTRSAIVDIVSAEFMIQKSRYIHNNPVRAGLCKEIRDWKWSSYRALHPANREPVPLTVDFPVHWRESEIASGWPVGNRDQ